MSGKIRYEVEWCSKCPLDECGDADLDKSEYSRTSFGTLDKSIKFALGLLVDKQDFFGDVVVEEQSYEIDQDILEHEERTVWKWFPLRVMHVNELGYEYSEKDLEHIDR